MITPQKTIDQSTVPTKGENRKQNKGIIANFPHSSKLQNNINARYFPSKLHKAGARPDNVFIDMSSGITKIRSSYDTLKSNRSDLLKPSNITDATKLTSNKYNSNFLIAI